MSTRPAAVAGAFYPGSPSRLREMVDRLLSAADQPGVDARPPVAIIAPHAGYDYSGPVAASAYVRLALRRDTVRRVVVLGPAHFVPLTGLTLPEADAFDTPLGAVPVDVACRDALAGRVVVADEPHQPEHSIEVQLPFLLRVLGAGWEFVPVLIDSAGTAAVPDLLDAAVDPYTVVVCSTDLSHYLDHAQATERDRRTAELITARDAAAIGSRDACGSAALRGLLTWADRHDLDIDLLDLRNSGDTAGGRWRVVGYGAFALTDR